MSINTNQRITNPLMCLCAALVLVGCASQAKDVPAAYVSPVPYQSMTCNQLREEASRVSSRVAIATGQQDKKAQQDALAVGVAVVVFWPAAFLVKGDSATSAELSRLKGEMAAIEQTSTAKNCGIVFQQAT